MNNILSRLLSEEGRQVLGRFTVKYVPKRSVHQHVMPATTEVMYAPEVVAVHNEFFTASDQVLAEANKLVQQSATDEVVKKGQRLRRLGFRQVDETLASDKFDANLDMTLGASKQIRGANSRYPFYKFITESQVNDICRKYNLLCAPIGRYKGNVPDRNLTHLEAFRLHPNDEVSCVVMDSYDKPLAVIYRSEAESIMARTDSGLFLNYKSPAKAMQIAMTRSGRVTINWDVFTAVMRSFGSILPNHVYGPPYLVNPGTSSDQKVEDAASLVIAAPREMIDTSGLTQIDTSTRILKHIPDPVVMARIREGYIIITAWGPEASDENVVNEQMQ